MRTANQAVKLTLAAMMCCGQTGHVAAADLKTPLTCKLGASMEADHMLDITNTTPGALKTETIVNLVINTAAPTPGEADDCFALTAPLAAKGHISHMVTLHIGGTPSVCRAFVSSKIPAIIHGSDGSATTQCDY